MMIMIGIVMITNNDTYNDEEIRLTMTMTIIASTIAFLLITIFL